MRPRPEEIRDRILRLRRALLDQRLASTRRGRPPQLAPIYDAHRFVLDPETTAALEAALTEATEDVEERLRRLLARVGEERVRAAAASLDDEAAAWERAVTLSGPGGEIPLREVPDAIADEEDRHRRRRLELARLACLEEVEPLHLDRLHRWREAIERLGYGDPVEARARLAGLRLEPLLAEAERILRETEAAYRDALRHYLERRVGVPVEGAEAHDVARFARLPWLDGRPEAGAALAALREDLGSLGLPLEAGGRVEVSLPARRRWGERSASFPLDPPERVVLVALPGARHADRLALLAAVGRALHAAWTDPALAPEYRQLGDPSVAEAHAATFAALLATPAWLRRAAGLDPGAAREAARAAAAADLLELRRLAARLGREVEVWRSASPAELAGPWAEAGRAALGYRPDPRSFLEGVDPWLGAAFGLRGRMAAAVCRRRLRDRFDEDWFRNPRAGSELGAWLAEGTRLDAAALAERAGAPRLRADELLAESLALLA